MEIPFRPFFSFFRTNVGTLLRYVGAGRGGRLRSIADRESLEAFLESRASHVAQSSLYGYLRTRAGHRHAELFLSDGYLREINVAKWQVWLACLSDLAVWAGGLAARRSPNGHAAVGPLIASAVAAILARAGEPEEAGAEFSTGAAAVLARLERVDWGSVPDDEDVFTESPGALVQWAPVVEHLKVLDEEIVRNSIRFRWQAVRREFREALQVPALLETAPE